MVSLVTFVIFVFGFIFVSVISSRFWFWQFCLVASTSAAAAGVATLPCCHLFGYLFPALGLPLVFTMRLVYTLLIQEALPRQCLQDNFRAQVFFMCLSVLAAIRVHRSHCFLMPNHGAKSNKTHTWVGAKEAAPHKELVCCSVAVVFVVFFISFVAASMIVATVSHLITLLFMATTIFVLMVSVCLVLVIC